MPTVLTEVRGGCLLITLNRPAAANAITTQLVDELLSAIALLDADPDLQVGVLTGAGAHFCAGMDLQVFPTEGKPAGIDRLFAAGALKPLIAAVEGAAVAGGLELALSCDVIVAAEDARLGLPEVKVGLLAAGGGVLRVAEALPRQTAMMLSLTGEPITGRRGFELGLVARVTPHGEALQQALLVAEQVGRNAPLAVAHSKALVRAAYEQPRAVAWAEQARRLAAVLASEDAVEGPRSFSERRPPNWVGR
ncbi:MAG: caiD [Frankiales bacterium]|nr:caiD [Frankiales bacterium]